MGEILDFCEKSNKMDMDPMFKEDAYLRVAALNALEKAGYPLNRDGLLQFQHNMSHPETGILSLTDFTYLIQVFEPDERQAVVNHLERNYNMNSWRKNNMKKNKKKPSYGSIILFLVLLCFFELYGITSCLIDLWRLTR